MPRTIASNRLPVSYLKRIVDFISFSTRHTGIHLANDGITVNNSFDYTSRDWTLLGAYYVGGGELSGNTVACQVGVNSFLFSRAQNTGVAGQGQKLCLAGSTTQPFNTRCASGKWHTYELRYTRSTNTATLVWDGVLDPTSIVCNFVSSSANTRIGTHHSSSSSGVHGNIYKCALLKRVTTDAESKIFHSTLKLPERDTGYLNYDFAFEYDDDVSSATLADKSPNHYVGTFGSTVSRNNRTPLKRRFRVVNRPYSLMMDGDTGRIAIPSVASLDDLFADPGGAIRFRFNPFSLGEAGSGRLFSTLSDSFIIDFSNLCRLQMSQDYYAGTNRWALLGVNNISGLNNAFSQVPFGKVIDLIINFNRTDPNGNPTAFIDGQKFIPNFVAVSRATGSALSDSGQSKFIGNRPASMDRTFHGSIELVEMYGRMLTDDEVKKLVFDSDYTDVYADLIEGWHPSEGSGNVCAGIKGVADMAFTSIKWCARTSSKTRLPVI